MPHVAASHTLYRHAPYNVHFVEEERCIHLKILSAYRGAIKFTLITDAASVVATEAGGGSRGIVVSTMCGTGSATPVPFDDAVTAWRALHAHLLA